VTPAALVAALWTAASLGVGQPAPELALPTRDGRTVTRGRLLGQVTAVEFFVAKSGGSRRSLATLLKLKSQVGRRLKVVVVDVRDSADVLNRFLARHPLPPEVDLALDRDGSTTRRWGVRAVPTTFVVDELGLVRQVDEGRASWAQTSRWLRQTLAGR
jgi:peroxiredoxin